MDGIDVTREIRHLGNVPLLILTARVEETDRLVGLELGADDYIPKPYSPREVVARVRAVLRRAGSTAAAAGVIKCGSLEIDVDSHTARLNERDLDLTPMEFSLLAAMAAQPGRAFSRLQLLEAAQGVAYEGYERTIDSHIKNLRAKLGDTPPRIETVFGIGYRYRKETPR
jgi:DNA-binding response OmpR family regulator